MPIEKFLDVGKPAPFEYPLVATGGYMSASWQQWASRIPHTLDSIPNVLNVVELSSQGASIGATEFSAFVLPPGIYRISYYARITRAATTSSSLTIAFGWVDGSISMTFTGAAVTGNTTATYQQGTVIIRSDAGEDVNYATTYASVGATSMQYSLDISIEKIKG